MPHSRSSGPPSSRSLRSGALLVASLLTVLGFASAAQAAPFAKRYGENVRGDIAFAANSLVSCADAAPNCAAARAGGAFNNNNFPGNMAFVDIDGDPTTDNSSQADLTIPAGATVTFAGLYWGGLPRTGATDAQLSGIQLRVPGAAGYSVLTADSLDTTTTGVFQGFVDVTDEVNAAKSGTYTVADAFLGNVGTQNDHGGWTLVVAYEDPTADRRNLTVYDGSASVSNGDQVPITIDGFQTPTSGPVGARMGFVSYEGDLASTGDGVRVNGTPITDAATPATNFFNSGISRFGVPVTDRAPSSLNQLGYDSKLVEVPDGVIPNGSSSAGIVVNSTSETFYPGVITTSLLLNDVQAVKRMRNVTDPGQPAQANDVLEYEVETSNGDGIGVAVPDATDVTLSDPVPANTAFVPGSLRLTDNPDAALEGPKTDAAADDQGELAGGNVAFRLGTGATATAGGTIENGERAIVRFRVRVNPGTPDGTAIQNTASVTYDAGGGPVSVDTSTVNSNDPSSLPAPPAPDVDLDGPAQDATTLVGIVTVPGGEPSPTEPCRIRIQTPTGWQILPATLVGNAVDGYRCEADVPAGLDAGDYPVEVTYTDADGRTSTDTGTLTITALPSAVIDGPAPGTRVPVGTTTPVDFGCTAPGGLASCTGTVQLPNGTVVPITDGAPLPTGAPGVYTVTVVVVDAVGRTSTVTRTYEVLAPPVDAPVVPAPPAPPAPGPAPAPAPPAKPAPTPGRIDIVKSISRRTLRPGQSTTVTLRVRNTGGSTLRNVRVCEAVPSGLKFVSATPKATLSKGQRCWTIKTLKPGQTARRSYRATALNRPGRAVTRTTGRATGARTDTATAGVRILRARPRSGGVTG